MKRLERDGAGDLSKPVVTEQSIQQWLGTKGMPYAVEIRGVCREMVKARPATAEWLGTVDWKICRSAETLAFSTLDPRGAIRERSLAATSKLFDNSSSSVTMLRRMRQYQPAGSLTILNTAPFCATYSQA